MRPLEGRLSSGHAKESRSAGTIDSTTSWARAVYTLKPGLDRFSVINLPNLNQEHGVPHQLQRDVAQVLARSIFRLDN